MVGNESEIEKDLRKARDLLEDSTWTLIFGFFALVIALVSVFYLNRGPSWMIIVLILPVIILLIFMFFIAEEWATHKRTIKAIHKKKSDTRH